MLYLQSAAKRTRLAIMGMLGSVMLAYLLAVVGLVGTATAALVCVFLAVWLSTLAGVADRRVALAVVLVVILVVLSLGVPSDGWDARSIWLFHGKRIFVDSNLYSQLDGYAGWSQNDYPVLVPMMMAGLAQLVGGWNEAFPKAAGTLMLLPAILVIALAFRRVSVLALFAVPLTMLGGPYLINGYMDAILAVYATASMVTLSALVLAGRDAPMEYRIIYALLTFVLVLLKNEALVVAAALFASAFIVFSWRERKLPWGMIVAFLIGLVPLLLWKLSVSSHHVVNDLASSNFLGQIQKRLPNSFYSIFILKDLLLRFWIVLPLILLFIVRKSLKLPPVQITLIASLSYVAILYIVYMGTPHDVRWHLQTSSSRTVMPIAMMLAFAALAAVDQSWCQMSAQSTNGNIQEDV